MKRLFVKLYLFFLKAFLSIFFSKKYLKGRLFQNDHYSSGWRFAKRMVFQQKIKGFNKKVPWPCSCNSVVINHQNIIFDIDYMDNFFNNGCYFQALGKIVIGKRTQIAPNVGIITSNHSIGNIEEHDIPKDVFIGDDCWIGMNSIILPGVRLGNHTIVGAGSIVTKSFPQGNCVIAGNPAKIIKML